MANTYKISILSLSSSETEVKVQLVNFQMPDVPINRCLGLQILVDAYSYLSDCKHSHIGSPDQKAEELLGLAAPLVVKLSGRIRDEHGPSINEELIEIAKSKIAAVSELSSKNFEKIDAWNEALEQGDEVEDFETLNVFQELKILVEDESLLRHLAPGLSWETAMYARDEQY